MTSTLLPADEGTGAAAAAAGSRNLGRLLVLGWWFTAVPMLAFGVQQLVLGRFTTRVTPGLPGEDSAPVWIVYVISLAIAAGALVMVLDRRRGRGIAILLGAAVLVFFVIMHVPRLVEAPLDRIVWLRALKGLTLASGAFAVAATIRRVQRVADQGLTLGFIGDRALFTTSCMIMGAYLVYCGYLHLSGPEGVARLVPAWIPGALGWAYFTGVALVLGGIGFWIRAVRRIAAALSSAMIFLWVLLLHIPSAISSSGFGSNATTATFEALAFSGLALIVAAASDPNATAARSEVS